MKQNHGARRRKAKMIAKAIRLGDPAERSKRELRINPGFRAMVQAAYNKAKKT